MTKTEHEEAMNAQAEKYLSQLGNQNGIIADLRYQLAQYRQATSALGWLIKQAMENPKVEP